MRCHSISAALIAVATCVLASPAARCAPASAAAKSAITAAYAKIDQAFDQKDVDSAISYCAADFKRILPTGQTATRDEMQANSKRMFAATSNNKSVTKITKLTQDGDTVTAFVNQTLHMTLTNPKTHKQSKVELMETDEDVWSQSGGTWQIRTSFAKSQKLLVDGKVVKQG